MEIREKDNNFIITPLSPKLSQRESLRLTDEIENLIRECDSENIGLDMSLVQDCTIDFIKSILSFKSISLFNIHSDIFAIFASMDIDKKIDLYVSELDFLHKKHKLINRKFAVI